MSEYAWDSIFAVHKFFADSDISIEHVKEIWYSNYDPWYSTPLTCFGIYKSITGHLFKPNSLLNNEVFNIKYLFLVALDLQDISSIKNLHKIEIIDCSLNDINNLDPLKHLTQLRKIEAAKNKINQLDPLSNLINLELLELMDNDISDISALFQLINLKELYLGGNKIQNISSLSNLTKLIKLDLSYNEINDITPLSSLPKLKVLQLNGNNLQINKIIELGKSLRNCKIFFGSEDFTLDFNPWIGYLYLKIINNFEVPFLISYDSNQNVKHITVALVDYTFKAKINAIEEMKNICRTLVLTNDRNNYINRDIKRELFFEETSTYVRGQFDY